MDEKEDGLILRALQASDGPRLVRMDERITGRNRSVWYERRLKRALEESDLNVSIGAEKDGVLVGAMLGSVQYGEFGVAEPVAVLETILVDERHQRRGIGTAMLEQFVRNLSRLGVERIRTEVGWTEALAVFLGLHGFDLAPRLVLERSLAADAGNGPAASGSFSATPRSE
ncbi:MAG TPA: GNAT family N-acetyltransferase [Thermoanaerobaculia bacterium]|nr:GNAT family N-acetyltransferase [Thermoanaerobaculia bacterium]